VVEFALVVPVLLLLTLTAIDFGRVFLGWVNVQQMTRIAASQAAEHASVWATPGDPTGEKAKYQAKVENDARAINCEPQNPIPEPILSGGTALGAPVTVGLTCEFHIITPIISNIIGGTIMVSSETTYPVKEGVVATVPGGGAPIVTPPDAKFVGSPQSGWGPALQVTFSNDSTGSPTSLVWSFAVASSGTGSGNVIAPNPFTPGPKSVTYECTGTPGQTCTFGVQLQVSNAGGSDTETKLDYITVTVPPAPPDPIAEFTGTPRSGVEPQTVNFSFVDLRGGTVTYTAYEWDFNADGVFDATGPNVSHNYPTDGVYDVTLKATTATGSNTLTKKAYIVITNMVCKVPDFGNTKKNSAQNSWSAAGFTTAVQFAPGAPNGNWTINTQTLTGGLIDPQPLGCGSSITVGP
jgi:PKD repeat protein